MMPIGAEPACTDYLEEVDAAFKRPGGRAALWMRKTLCPSCPINEQCLADGAGEYGVWGGTSAKGRTHSGGAPAGRAYAGVLERKIS